MKKLIILLLLFSSFIYAHRHHAHQYITIEAYNLLKLYVGCDIPTLQSRLGGTSSFYIGDRPWQRGYIITGAWREDEEDIVYGYSKSNPPTLTGIVGLIYSFIAIFGGITPDGFVSSTHFWYADDGDELSTTMRAGIKEPVLGTDHVVSFTIPNAYQKFMKFSNPNRSWTLKYFDGYTAHQSTFTKAGGGKITIYWYDYLGFQYSSLKDLYLSGQAWIVGYYNVLGQWVSCNYEIVLGQGWRDAFTWEILGRMCHLLQDMSVPAHTNIDPHGDNPGLIDDYYESYFGYNFYWDAQNVYSQIGEIINPYQYQAYNPLHFLIYTTNQMANHFLTQGPHKKPNNDFFGGNGNLGGCPRI